MTPFIPCLWFDKEAEQAAKYYVSIFGKNSKIQGRTYYEKNSHGKAGSVLTVSFTLNGQEFIALNGGPNFKFNESVSFYVPCRNQKEVDHFWEKLSRGGKKNVCGWLKDKYGVSWQVTPDFIFDLMKGGDRKKFGHVLSYVMKMTKLDYDVLKKAAKEK